MKKWDVQVNGVKHVVENTVNAAKPIEKHTKSLGHEMQNASNASGIDIVAQALESFAQHVEQVLPDISKEFSAVINGAVKATNAYILGDEHMAIEAQRAAARATGILPPLHQHHQSPQLDAR